MKNKATTLLIVINSAILCWCLYSTYYLASTDINEAIMLIEKTPEASLQAVEIYKNYSNEQKEEKLQSFINLFEKLSIHLEATKDTTLEAVDTLQEYTYAFLVISIFNLVTVIYLAK